MLNGEQLHTLLNDTEFISVATQLGGYTLDTQCEAGFAVYGTASRLHISKLLTPENEISNRGDMGSSLNMDPLIITKNGLPHDDIQSIIHSHPEPSTGYSFIPSPLDMVLMHDVEEDNPNHLFGILQQGARHPELRVKLCRTTSSYDPTLLTSLDEMLQHTSSLQKWKKYIVAAGIAMSVAVLKPGGCNVDDNFDKLFD